MKLDNLDPRMRPRRVEPADVLDQVDQIVGGVLARQTDQAERFRQILTAIKSVQKAIEGKIDAIPTTDLAPVLGALAKNESSLRRSIAEIRFPEYPTPKDVDLSAVLGQIDSLLHQVRNISASVAAMPTELPEITVAAANAQPAVVEAPRPRHWTFKVTRNQRGFDVDAQAVD